MMRILALMVALCATSSAAVAFEQNLGQTIFGVIGYLEATKACLTLRLQTGQVVEAYLADEKAKQLRLHAFFSLQSSRSTCEGDFFVKPKGSNIFDLRFKVTCPKNVRASPKAAFDEFKALLSALNDAAYVGQAI